MSRGHAVGSGFNMNEFTPPLSAKFSRRVKTTAIILAGYALAAGFLSFCGWVFNISRLTDWGGNGISIQPNTTLCVISSGVAIILLALGKRKAAGYLGIVPLSIALLTVFEYVTSLDLGIDTLLMFGREWGRRGVLAPGRMGPPSVASWNLIGGALVIAGWFPHKRRIVPYLSLTATFIALLTFVGYLYGADFLYTLPRLTVIAWQTCTFILAVAVGLTLTITEREPLRTFLADNAGGLIARRTMPILLFLPIVFGSFRVWGQNEGEYDTPMGTAMLVLAVIVVMCIVLWRGAVAASAYQSAAEHKDRQLAAIVDSSHDAIVSKGLDSIITSWNLGAERLFGYTPDEAIGKSIRMLIPDNRQGEEDEIRERIVRGESLDNYETVRQRKDGTLLHISLTVSPIKGRDGSVIGMSKVARNITQQKEAEWAIRDSEVKKAAILESAVDCVITMDHEGRIVDFNPAAERTFGWTRDQVVGKAVADTIVPERLRARHRAGFEHYLLTAEKNVLGRLVEMPALRSDGTEFPAEVSITDVMLADSPPFFTAFIRDITQRKTAEEALKVAHDQLESRVADRTRELVEANALLVAETEARVEEQTQRIDIMRRLVAGQESERQRIGRDIHDHLGQRLTALRLQLESLKSAMADDPTGKTAQLRLDTLDDLARVLDAEVSYLAWELRPTVLDQFGLIETLRIFVQEWSKQFGVAADFHAGTLGSTLFDKEAETHLYRITQEALNNIAKHAEAKNVSVQLARRDETLSLIIDDDGRGFAAGNGRKKNATGGQGLRGMLERADLIGGEFHIESTPGSGTTVFVRISESSNGNSGSMDNGKSKGS
jgi:PAS domain S-box-containing protein